MTKLVLFLLTLSGFALATPTVLEVKQKVIEVNGKKVTVDSILQANGTWGYYAHKGQIFDVIVKNELAQPTVIHWHGLLLPNNQDGTPLTQRLIPPGGEYHYHFKLQQTGSYWMHSHFGLQLQNLAEAPLIIEDKEDKNYQQVIVMFQDFSFLPPEQIMANLIHKQKSANMPDMLPMHPDLNDVKYDAFLTNYHTLTNPQVVQVKPKGAVKLRFINGSASSNFWIKLGKLHGQAIAVDGAPIQPITGNLFQLAIGQRMDIKVKIPQTPSIFPILGQVEGSKFQTGIILTSIKGINNFPLPPSVASKTLPALNYDQELRLVSINQLPKRKVNQIINLNLGGNMRDYIWTINQQSWPQVKPIIVKQGEMVEMVINNNTMMSHPIHLHGNVFKIIQINRQTINGALRDTILVMPHSTIKILFIATQRGNWLLHCHMLYHMHAGMTTYLKVN